MFASAVPVQVRAQDGSVPARLEDLIPDSAVADPEGWANGEAQADQAESDASAGAQTPIPEMPLVSIPWPGDDAMPQVDPVEPAAQPIEFADFAQDMQRTPLGSEERISEELVLVFPSERSLFPERDEFLDRFASLSTIEQLDDDENQARLAAQARSDEALLNRLLRTYGYFGAEVIRSVGDIDPEVDVTLDRPAVRFDVIPGTRYRVGEVDLGELANTGEDYGMLRDTYAVWPGDPISLDDVEDERFDLDTALGENGYPFAAIENPSLLVDHDRQEGDVDMPVTPGGKYAFGSVVSAQPDFLSSRHLARIARFEPGDIYRRSEEMDLRRAILATGLVGSVTLEAVEVEPPQDGEPGVVDMQVGMTRAPLRTLRGGIGYGTEEGLRLEGSWEHRNLFPPEGSLRVRGIVGTQEQLAGVTFRKNNFYGRDRILTVDTFVSTIDYEAYDARTISAVGTYERTSNLLFQKPFSWSVGLELVATQESERDADGVTLPRETFLIAALPLFAQLDTSDDLLDPTEGWRLAGRLSPEISDRDGVQSFYVRSQVDASYYQQVGESVVMAGRVRAASIPGADTNEIAPSRRLYAGGGGSVRGYGYREIGPENDSGDPTGGRSLVEFSLEARIQTGFMDGAVSVVPFVDAGTVGDDTMPDFGTIKFGAGVGIRYDTGFGPLRVDVATPLNPGPNDDWIAVYIALGQAF